jgi:cyclophilin family peptidyl-prolyl cis-trans isomerase
VPSEKRARQRANKRVGQAELRRRQVNRRRLRIGAIGAALVIVAVVLAIVTTSGGSSGKKKTKLATSATTSTTVATTSTTGTATTSTTAAPTSVDGLPVGLTTHTAPAISKNCSNPQTSSTPTTTVAASGNAVSIVPAPANVGFPSLNGSSPRYTKFSAAPPFCIDVSKTYTATMVTDAGTMTIELYPKAAPVTVNNFVFLAGYHFFDGTVFHRVIPGFVDQGGDPTGTGTGGPGYEFKDELPTSAAAYVNGALAMANSGANTNGSQFFIVVKGGGAQLQPSYSMYGKVTSGLAVANAINADGTSSGTPTKIHKVLKVTISES